MIVDLPAGGPIKITDLFSLFIITDYYLLLILNNK